MTSLSLLLGIVLGVALQAAIYLGVAFWRHWHEYQELRLRASGSEVAGSLELPPPDQEVVIAAWPGFRTFRVAGKIVEDLARSVCSFHLVPEDGKPLPSFLPGQFLTFRLDIPTAHGGTEQVIRCYSLSDAPRPDHYRISVKRVPPPAGCAVPPGRSSGFFHDQVSVGTLLQVRAPAGHFHLDHSDAPAVLIAGGIGITPMLSMVNWCLAEQPGRELWLYYGARSGRELIMKEHLHSLAARHPNFRLRICLSDPRQEDIAGRDYHHRGRVEVALLRMQLPLKPYRFYICGPTPLMESLVPALEDWGVPDAHIHYEAFGPASIMRRHAAPPDAAGALPADIAGDRVVTFARSGKSLAWQGALGSLLELAEVNGIAVNSGCRAGSCGSCQTAIRSGQVSYRQPPDYDPEPGTCLLCVCVPKTSVTLEA